MTAEHPTTVAPLIETDMASHSEIELRQREILVSRIEGLIDHLNDLKAKLESATPGRPLMLANGSVETSLHNLLSSEGPGNY